MIRWAVVVSELVFKSPFFYIMMVPKVRSSDADNSYAPKGSFKVLPLSEKVKFLNLIRRENNCMLRLQRSTERMYLPMEL